MSSACPSASGSGPILISNALPLTRQYVAGRRVVFAGAAPYPAATAMGWDG